MTLRNSPLLHRLTPLAVLLAVAAVHADPPPAVGDA